MDLHQRDTDKMEEIKSKSLRQLLVDFMGYTTSHGLARLAESTTILWKIFWIVSCLASFGMFVYQVGNLFNMYFSRPVQTFMTVNFEKHLAFPAVTICNLNMIKLDGLPNELADVFPTNVSYPVKTDVKTPNITRVKLNDTKGEYDEYDHSKYLDDVSYTDDKHITHLKEEYQDESVANEETKLRRTVEQLIGILKPEELYPIGHTLNDLIKNCTWKGLDCKTGKFSSFWVRSWNYKYGNCYTFNNGVDEENKPIDVLKATKSGPAQGLVLHLNIEQDQYIGALTRAAGVRVTLHEQGATPFPYDEGFSVGPGMATSVAITKKLVKRLDRFGNKSCITDNTLPKGNIFKRYRNNSRYSQQACLRSCLGLSQTHTCKCSESSLPSSLRPCDTFNTEERECLQKVKYLYNRDELNCVRPCRRLCNEETYLKTISASQWPSTAYQNYLSSQNKRDKNRSSLLLNVFYSQLNYEKVEQKYSYGTTNLLADIGGQLGLWIGISALTTCEILELIIKFFTLAFAKFKTRNDVIDVRQTR